MAPSSTPCPISPTALLNRTQLLRTAALSELGLPSREEFRRGPAIFSAAAEIIAGRITTALREAEAEGLSLSATKRAVRAESEFAGEMLLAPSSLNGRTLPELLGSASDTAGWKERIEGELRTRLVVGESSQKRVQEVLQAIVRSDELRDMLSGIDGYRWVADTLCEGRMLKAHKLTSAACKGVGRKLAELGWEACLNCTTEQFDTLCKALTTGWEQYKGLAGYRLFSDTFAGGDMQKGYILTSAICKFSNRKFAELGWEALLHGTTKEFDKLRDALTTGWEQYKGLAGYRLFSATFAGGDMQKGYMLTSAICKFSNRKFAELGWEASLQCTTEEFDTLCYALTTGWEQYQGLAGYRLFSDTFAGGDMQKGYILTSAICKFSNREFAELGWEAVLHCTTEDFDKLCKALTTGWEQYQGLAGYRRFSDTFAGGDMQKGYMLTSAICKFSDRKFDELGWEAQLQCTTKEFDTLCDALTTGWEQYQGLAGYRLFSDTFAGGDMQKGYILTSAICKFSNREFAELGWEAVLHCTTEDFDKLCKALTTGWEQYQGLAGYRRFSDTFAGGDMQKGYMLTSAICKFSNREFAELGWEAQLNCTTEEFDTLCEALTTGWEQYQGLAGYRRFSDTFARGDMLKGYMLTSAICKFSNREFAELGWEACLNCTTKDFDKLCEALTTGWEQYKGLAGYRLFSDTFAGGDMQKGYKLTSAICKFSNRKFDELGWEASLQCTTEEFDTLCYALTTGWEQYQGLAGYRRFSDTFAGGDMKKGYMLTSAICKFTGREFDGLAWPPAFAGSVAQHRAIEGFVMGAAHTHTIEALLGEPRAERIDRLRALVTEAQAAPSIKELSRLAILAALPERISPRVGRGDFFVEGVDDVEGAE